MSIDYIVASLPPLAFDAPAPLTPEQFRAVAGEVEPPARWRDLETQLRNAMAEARGGGDRWRRPAEGCDLYWRGRVAAAFAETDPLKREALLDRTWWDAAGELTPPGSPLSKGALQTYAIRLKIVQKRGRISTGEGNAAFDRLTAETGRRAESQGTERTT